MQARITWIVMFVLSLAVAGGGTHAQKGRITGGPSDAVFADRTGENPDRIRSDAPYITQACASGVVGEGSRYCGDNYFDPATGLTYGGLGPECSRISHGTGQYSFRTISSKCPTDVPTGGGRRLTLDFSQHFAGACRNEDSADDSVSTTVIDDKNQPVTRTLNVCGPNLVDDVQIIAETMFGTGSSSVVTIYFSLHAPPLSNVMQFVMEFTRPLPVGDSSITPAARVLSATDETAVLWRMTVGRGGKVQKAATPIGEYLMPFTLTARKAPMPTFPTTFPN